MNVTIATACDSAKEYGGRLCLMGTFDTISTTGFPYVKQSCTMVIQIQWEHGEIGHHTIRAHFMDQDGSTTLQDMESEFEVAVADGNLYSSTNHLIHLNQLTFHKAGPYLVAISVDGESEAEICIQVRSEEDA